MDINPLFPLEAVRVRILGRDDPALAAAEQASETAEAGRFVEVNAVSGLNLRSWPSFNPNIISTIPAPGALKQMKKPSLQPPCKRLA